MTSFAKTRTEKFFHDFFTVYFAELRKFAARFLDGKPVSRFEQRLFLLKNIQNIRLDDLPKKDELFEKVFDICNYQKLNTMEKQEYEKSVLDYEDVQDAIVYNKRLAYEEGAAKGKAEGIAEGIANTARKMLSMGLDIHTIVEATGLSEQEISEITK